MKKIFILLIIISTLRISAAEKIFYGPHITSANPWINKIIVFNSNSENESIELDIFNSNGVQEYSEFYSVSKHDKLTFVLTNYESYVPSSNEIVLNPIEGSFSVKTSSESVSVILSFQFGNSQSVSEFFLSSSLNKSYFLPNMDTGSFSWSGIALMNNNELSTSVKLTAFKEGNKVGEKLISINPNSKYVELSENIWENVDITKFDGVVVTSDNGIPNPIIITGNSEQNRHLFFSGTPVTISDTTNLTLTYPIVDTNQSKCFDNLSEISTPTEGSDFYGQDGNYSENPVSYTDNNDGTITDNVTGLMWTKDPGEKMTFDKAVAGAETCSVGGYSDWRLPTIKELYSLIIFSGKDPSGYNGSDTSILTPFIDTSYFNFQYGDESSGERIIDSQFATSTLYTSYTMNADETMFGVNFADGRIKGYPKGKMPNGQNKTFFVLYVRGNSNYGLNNFVDNGDGTITDLATSLMWMTVDSGTLNAGTNSDGKLNWQEALNFAENLDYAGHTDWRLPNAKELQSIVDYTRSPDYTSSAAIDPLFSCTEILNEAGVSDYPFYWTGTTHENQNTGANGGHGVYVCFGRAMGYMNSWIDVHGAGAQRSDPKEGDPENYPEGHGPQGDAIRIYNFVRCVRSIGD